MKPQFINTPIEGLNTVFVKQTVQSYFDGSFHFHHLCELVFIEQGFGKRIVGDAVDNFETGDLVLMAPGLPHIWKSDALFHSHAKEEVSKSIAIYFPANFLFNLTDDEDVLMPTKRLIQHASRGLQFYGAAKCEAVKLIKKIVLCSGYDRIICFLKIINLFVNTNEYTTLSSLASANMNKEDTQRISVVYEYVTKNFRNEIKLKEVAALCHMTGNSFCRYFKSKTNKSFKFFLNELRIGHACKLLRDEDLSITSICYECGFNNLQNFNKFFKTLMKCTPSEYRRKLVGI